MGKEYFYQPLCILGIGGIVIWVLVLCSFICIKIQQRQKIDLQWIKNHEKKTKLPISKTVDSLEKTIQVFRKLLKIIKGFTIFFSLSFLVRFLLHSHYNDISFNGVMLTANCIPMWLNIIILITFFDNKRKRIIEVMKETRSEQQSSLSEAREGNRTEMKDI